MPTMNAFTFEIIGHRGCEGLAPENSLAAMRKAIELGIDRVEFDVNTAKDGSLIVIHNPVVKIGLKQVPLGKVDRLAIARAKGVPLDDVPLLDDVLATCKGKIKIQAELKGDGIEAGVVAAIQKSAFPVADTSISSFDLGKLARVREIAPSLAPVQLVYLLDKEKNVADVIDEMRRIGVGSLSIHASHVTCELVDSLHEHGIRALAWGVGEKGKPRYEINSTYQCVLGSHVDGFTCAYPDVLKEIVRAGRPGG
jgi:glycerophosphoryl diester phosphodiesterase